MYDLTWLICILGDPYIKFLTICLGLLQISQQRTEEALYQVFFVIFGGLPLCLEPPKSIRYDFLTRLSLGFWTFGQTISGVFSWPYQSYFLFIFSRYYRYMSMFGFWYFHSYSWLVLYNSPNSGTLVISVCIMCARLAIVK